jgi:hypothetical protein
MCGYMDVSALKLMIWDISFEDDKYREDKCESKYEKQIYVHTQCELYCIVYLLSFLVRGGSVKVKKKHTYINIRI